MSFTIANKKFPDALPELHTHVRSDKDAFIFPNELVARMKEMGMTGLAITDHGVLSSIEDYRHVLSDNGLKIIPGVEAYVENNISGRDHAVLLAVDDIGYKGISKIVTESNKNLKSGYPVVTEDTLCSMATKYRGHIIFTTACMQGVLSSVFLRNEKIDWLIAKNIKKRDMYISPTSDEYLDKAQELDEIDEKIVALREKRDSTKRIAEQKFAAREKRILKLEGQQKEEAKALLDADKEKASKAAEELPDILNELKKTNRQRTAINKELTVLKASTDKYTEYSDKISELEKRKADDKTLFNDAMSLLDKYIAAFGQENVYGEIQYHGLREEKVCYPKVVEVCKERGIKLVATNDVHMLTNSKADLLRRSILRSMRFQERFEAPSRADKELYLKTTKERYEALSQIFSDDIIAEAFSGIEEIYNRCNVEFTVTKNYPIASDNPKEDLEALVKKGIKQRFPDSFPDEEVYKKRLAYEIDVIESMGYDNYHLVVCEFLTYGKLLSYVPKEFIPEAPLDTEELKKWILDNDWDKNAGYRIGTGRGSDGGSLVCYLLGITNLDPIKHGLLFERFLNKERVSMPDIDSDISADTRGKVIDHCKYVYGKDAVCGIMTSTFLAPKGAVNTAAKYYSMYKFSEKDNKFVKLSKQISDAISDEVGIAFNSTVDKNTGKLSKEKDAISLKKYLYNIFKGNEDAVNILKWAISIEGIFKGYGAHAAGIVITKKGSDVSDVLPLRYNSKVGMFTTQCVKEDVEANGLLKFDFLGLKTLDIITETLFMIKQRTGKSIDVLSLDTSDKNVYEKIFQAGNTGAVFQFESDGMKQFLKDFKPSCFSDLVLLNAAYRPGPMQFLDEIVAVKNKRKPMTFLTPQLEPILKDTYGAIIYQEQVMQICQKLAGYSLGGADLVRRAMSKKKADKLEHERDAFIHGDKSRGICGCVANGISEEIAQKIFNQMMDFASYAFNKSHAAAYSYNSFITAWLKCYYPAEFYAAALNWADTSPDKDKLTELLKDARAFGIEILPPDINKSDCDFSVEDGKVRFALSKIKGVKNHGKEIVAERTKNGLYKTLTDVLLRTKTTSTVIKALILSGCFDEITKKSRSDLLIAYESLRDKAKKYNEKHELTMAIDTVMKVYHEGISESEIAEALKTAGIKPVIKTVSSTHELEEKERKTATVLSATKREMIDEESSVVTLDDEDKLNRLLTEKKYLGDYISDSPLSGFSDNKKLGVSYIKDVSLDTKEIFGYIEDVSEVKTKKDGSLMGFFTVTDKTGSIKALVFADRYKELKEKLTCGKVYVFEGEMSDKDGEMSFIINKVKTPIAVTGVIVVDPGDLRIFHLTEDGFRKKYEKEDGFKLVFIDKALGILREATYKVSSDVLNSRYSTRLI